LLADKKSIPPASRNKRKAVPADNEGLKAIPDCNKKGIALSGNPFSDHF